MADGNNRAFMKAGRKFLKDNIIVVNVIGPDLIEVATKHVDPNKAVLATRGQVPNRGEATLPQVTPKAAGIYDFDLMKATRKGERKTSTMGIEHMTSVPVFDLVAWGRTKARDYTNTPQDGGTFTTQYHTPAKARPISAYWCPWGNNSCWSVQLGNDADYFFTPTMDGCSLSISSGASPLVSHGNYRDVNNPNVTDEARTLGQDQRTAPQTRDRCESVTGEERIRGVDRQQDARDQQPGHGRRVPRPSHPDLVVLLPKAEGRLQRRHHETRAQGANGHHLIEPPDASRNKKAIWRLLNDLYAWDLRTAMNHQGGPGDSTKEGLTLASPHG